MQHTTPCTSLHVEGRVDFVFRNGFISRADTKPFMWKLRRRFDFSNFIAIYDDDEDEEDVDFKHSALLRFTNPITHLEVARHSALLLDYSTIPWSDEVTIEVKASSSLRLTNEQPFQRPSKLNLNVSDQSVFAAASDASETLRWHVKNLSLKVSDSYVSNLRASTSLAIDADYLALVFVHVSDTIADTKVTHNERQGSNVYVTSKASAKQTLVRCTTCTRLKRHRCFAQLDFIENRALSKFSGIYNIWRSGKELVVDNETIAYNLANNRLKASRRRKEPPANAILPVLYRSIGEHLDLANHDDGGGGGGSHAGLEDVDSEAWQSFSALYRPAQRQRRLEAFRLPVAVAVVPREAVVANPLNYQITLLNPVGIGECTICCDATINVQVAPCMHAYSCRNCAVEYKELGKHICAICRVQIKEIVPLLVQMPSEVAKGVKRKREADDNVDYPPPAATTTITVDE